MSLDLSKTIRVQSVQADSVSSGGKSLPVPTLFTETTTGAGNVDFDVSGVYSTTEATAVFVIGSSATPAESGIVTIVDGALDYSGAAAVSLQAGPTIRFPVTGASTVTARRIA